MELEEIYSNLCWHDPRSPSYDKDDMKQKKCSCDNCFYGSNRLALEILKLREEIEPKTYKEVKPHQFFIKQDDTYYLDRLMKSIDGDELIVKFHDYCINKNKHLNNNLWLEFYKDYRITGERKEK